MDDFDVWLAVNAERLSDGRQAVCELLPHLNSQVEATVVVPSLVRMEAAVSEMTYSEFDSGNLSAAFAQAGSSLRSGFDAVDRGDAKASSRAFSRAIEQYDAAITQTMRWVPGPEPPTRRTRWWPWLAALVVLLVLL